MDTKQKETDIETAVQIQIKQPVLEKNCENLMRLNERTRQNFKESRLEKRLNRKFPKTEA
jgi:hypothetical protein